MARPSLEDQAAGWLAWMDRADVHAADRAAFTAWRAADPKHEAACVRLEIGWQRFDRLRALRPPQGAPDVQLLADTRLSSDIPLDAAQLENRRFQRLQRFALAASLAALPLCAAWYFGLSRESDAGLGYATRVGEYRRIVLDDRSVVELDTATQLNVSYTARRREIELRQGRARFTVAREAARPFAVLAGATRVQALGTTFSVRREKEAVEVVVTDGRVAVASPTQKKSQLVAAGQRAAALPQGVRVQKLAPREAERSLAWTEGVLAFEGATLANVVAEFNRYNQTQLIIADPALASLRMGGYFHATGVDALLATLGRSFGIRAESRGPDEIELLATRAR